ncbi:hypothetical protein COU89_01120 [Candidatus Roizmanbacteria bacterium CG10_big_fil_rev_8_21_14_0_10_45_7]|uniref:Type II secretion system protein n=1 Tax=Candidatus Roizmanbacteria bacterium CG10_big_fil_rev_8_21_14_0_10_45_7 TaxID=1974854 RepID=A0A2M8KV98_9BACT|nr:MAG: hypothetical protein COU89_01120 [Candidatus Roizmanbacteria bacterium CG10_big_fil_rev_8_21_14_0_10_45_7]
MCGFTLIELLIFISLITTVLVITIGAVSYAISALNDSRNRTLASHYPTELAEWMRFRRDVCYLGDLTDHAGSSLEETLTRYYCFNDIDIANNQTCLDPDEWPPEVASCNACNYTLGGNLQRCAGLAESAINNRVEVTITTSWYSNNAKQNVTTYMFLSSQ